MEFILPDEPQVAEHIVDAIISRNGAALYREETVPNTGKGHTTMRHGFAGCGFRQVSRIVFDFVGCSRVMSSSLRGQTGQDRGVRFSAILPPGSWQLVSGFLVRREVNAWTWVLLGWVGTLLVGSQVMKLMMEGIHLRVRQQALGVLDAAP